MLEFDCANKKHPLTLSGDAELFTNCRQLIITRIVNNHRFQHYRQVEGGVAKLPAGHYELEVMSCSNDCWACVETTETTEIPETHFLIEQNYCVIGK